MIRLIAFLSTSVLLASGLFGSGEAESKSTAGVSFSQDIQPLLQRSCQGCHQPSSRQGGLDVTNFENLRTGGQHGATFVTGAPDRSLILAHLTGDREPRMPLGLPPLDASDIELFRNWIASGARDDSSEMATRLAGGEPPVYRQPPVITALAYSPDGGTLAVSGYREVLLHRDSDSEPDARLVGTADRIQSLGFTADGKTLMAAGGRPASFGEVQFWDVDSGRLLRAVRELPRHPLRGVAFSGRDPGGLRLCRPHGSDLGSRHGQRAAEDESSRELGPGNRFRGGRQANRFGGPGPGGQAGGRQQRSLYRERQSAEGRVDGHRPASQPREPSPSAARTGRPLSTGWTRPPRC